MDTHPLASAERDALLALWAVPGIGSIGLGGMRRWAAGRWADLLDTPARDWVDGLPASDLVRARLRAAGSLRAVADEVRDRAARGTDGGAPSGRPRLSRASWSRCVMRLRSSSCAARWGVHGGDSRWWARGIRSRASSGTPGRSPRPSPVAGRASCRARRPAWTGPATWAPWTWAGETWAFLGSALDVVDPAQAHLVPLILDGGGAVYSELPPGIRASRQTFPRRNRLISGASDAVLILRAGERSGAMHTVAAARVQGRPILACPGETWAEAAQGCNLLVARGLARLCIGPPMRSGRWGSTGRRSPPRDRSRERCRACRPRRRGSTRCSSGTPCPVEELEERAGLDPGGAVSALCELELLGLAIQTPGRRYQRV